ncbi:sensor histidine kinase [Polaribacter ponticola]|uniref:Sensor histidine kinase n=1 Tax=Polaribacter ponticola TaxID=2978475 RepID=A0ABT5S592_9FLAO|nr:sensor histidine kinase [Polaribacter sp. MSW5]MDD7913274.1 sensor histidine kinase [Polaribacter sp. MSW5]
MKKYLEAIIHVLVWVIAYFLILNYINTISDFRKGDGPFWLAVLFGMLMSQVLFYSTALVIVPKYLRLKKIVTLIITLTCFFVFINLFESLIDYYWLVGFFSTEDESYLSYLNYNTISSFFILLLGLSYALIKYWIQNEKLKRLLYEEKLTTEMAFLKSQINPHFLFNVLNSFYAKALKNDVPDLADGISKLAELMRYMVYETNENTVALEKEIHHLKKFIQVYQLRIADEDDVFINFTIKGNVENVKISPMLLIPFVENAIKHGVDIKTKSIIDIFIEVTKNGLIYKVTNTLQKTAIGLKENSSGFGLDNLKKG